MEAPINGVPSLGEGGVVDIEDASQKGESAVGWNEEDSRSVDVEVMPEEVVVMPEEVVVMPKEDEVMPKEEDAVPDVDVVKSDAEKAIEDGLKVDLEECEAEEEEEVDVILNPLTLTEMTVQQQQGLLPNMSNPAVNVNHANRVTMPPNRISQLYMNNHLYNYMASAQRVGMAIPTSLDSTPNINMLRSQQANIMNILQGGMKSYELELDPDAFEEKNWNRPGERLSDYFNYGFNPETWKLFLLRQRKFREENNNAAAKKPPHFGTNTPPAHRGAPAKANTPKSAAEDSRRGRPPRQQDRDDRNSGGSSIAYVHAPEIVGGPKSDGRASSQQHSHRKEGGGSGHGGHRSRDRRGSPPDDVWRNDRTSGEMPSHLSSSERSDRDRAAERERLSRAERELKAARNRNESRSSRQDEPRDHYSSSSSSRRSHGRHDEKYGNSRSKRHRGGGDRGYVDGGSDRKRSRA